MKNNVKNIVLILASLGIVIGIILLQLLVYKGFTFEIYNSNNIFELLFSYILLGLIVYQILKGIVILDLSTFWRNVRIMLIGNLILYSVLFFTNPSTQIHNFFEADFFNYFKGYFLFSLLASLVCTGFFHEYRKDVNSIGFNRTVIWKYFFKAIFSIQGLYALFIIFVNQLFPKKIFYSHWTNYVLVGFITSIFLFLFYYLEKRRNSFEKELKKEATKAETATANFETLKNQLDPHFLFNSLNVLTGLIEENPEKAVDFTTSLSKIYRYLLEQKDKEVVPLEEEIKFAKTYINLLKLRFENSIHFHMNMMNFEKEEFIVPLSLQILLENTIKHNIVTESKPLKIRIYKEDNFLIVENSYQPKESIKDSTGVGLNNIKNRYELISNQEIDIQQTEEIFSVKLPILTQRINVTKEDNLDYEQAKEKVEALKKFYKNLMFYGFALVFSFFMFDNLKYWIISTIFIILFVIKEWIKVSGIEEKWEKYKTQEILEKKNQSKKWN